VPEDYSHLPRSAKEARASGSLYYFTGKSCKQGHVAKRFTCGNTCYKCSAISRKKHLKTDYGREAHNRRTLAWRKTPEGIAYSRSNSANRRAFKTDATPEWADLKAIKEFYAACPEGYHVDHIIPLKNGVFPAFHSLENLQYLPAQENISKHNKVDPLSLKHYPCCVLPEYRSYVSPQSAGALSGSEKDP
jgi:hypothetical protein